MDMARQINKLSAKKVSALAERGFYCDGGGLYLSVAVGGSKSWVFRYKRAKRVRDMGLGSLITLGLSNAREAATDCRRQLLKGIDPLEAKRADRTARALEAAKAMTFDQCAAAYIADNSVAWKNAKHRQQWKNTLATYVSPVIGKLPVQGVDTGLVSKILRPIWNEKTETAIRIRGRIETVLNWATAHSYRIGDNPARWSGNLEHLLPARSELKDHFPALPYAEIGGFMAELRQRVGIGPRALEFTILTAARTGQAIRAEWSEFDLEKKLWVIPAERMKATREHTVTLSDAAVTLLRKMERRNKFVFAGRGGGCLSDMAMNKAIRDINAAHKKAGLPKYIDPKEDNREIVPHGFRASFKTWAQDRSNFPDMVSEVALAHKLGDDPETYNAYARGELLEKRFKLMEAWAGYCAAPATTGKVILINRQAAQ
jgi:integrase